MKIFLVPLLIFFIAGISEAQVGPSNKSAAFPSEVEVTNFLKVGLEKPAVVSKLGEPSIKDPQPDGSEIYYYFQPPYKAQKDENFVYGGFQISFKNDKVTLFSIIHKDVRLPPKK